MVIISSHMCTLSIQEKQMLCFSKFVNIKRDSLGSQPTIQVYSYFTRKKMVRLKGIVNLKWESLNSQSINDLYMVHGLMGFVFMLLSTAYNIAF